MRYYNNGLINVSPNLANGVLAMAGTTGYRNGTSEATTPGGGTISHTLYIGAANDAGTLFANAATKIQALAIYSTTLSGANVAALTTAINAL